MSDTVDTVETQSTRGSEGNINPPPVFDHSEGEVKGKKYRGYVFTMNNYTEEQFDTVTQYAEEKCKYYIIGKELAPTTGTPHLQGYLYFANAVNGFNILKNINSGTWIAKAKGKPKSQLKYCSKSEDFVTNMNEEDFEEKSFVEKLKEQTLLKEYKDVVWKDWQQNVIEILENEPDNRSINWFWEDRGNTGKSYLCKYLCLIKDVILCDGKKENIFNQVKSMIDNEKIPEVIICDIPRTSFKFLNYGAIEQLKNGCIYSGKYEGGLLMFPIPHVIIFANEEPDVEALSADRWRICNLDGRQAPSPIKDASHLVCLDCGEPECNSNCR